MGTQMGGGLSPSPGGKLEEDACEEALELGLWNGICLGNPDLLLSLRPSLFPTHTRVTFPGGRGRWGDKKRKESQERR